MPSRASGLATAVASTTFSPRRTTAAPWACFANFPVSKERFFPPVSSTETVVGSGFIDHPFVVGRHSLVVRTRRDYEAIAKEKDSQGRACAGRSKIGNAR